MLHANKLLDYSRNLETETMNTKSLIYSILYTPELMLEHEKILDDTSIQYRKLLCSVLTKN